MQSVKLGFTYDSSKKVLPVRRGSSMRGMGAARRASSGRRPSMDVGTFSSKVTAGAMKTSARDLQSSGIKKKAKNTKILNAVK